MSASCLLNRFNSTSVSVSSIGPVSTLFTANDSKMSDLKVIRENLLREVDRGYGGEEMHLAGRQTPHTYKSNVQCATGETDGDSNKHPN
jgi:hypothetical protein